MGKSVKFLLPLGVFIALAALLSVSATGGMEKLADLLPSDLLGMSILNPTDGSFFFNEGPVFTNLLLAEENYGMYYNYQTKQVEPFDLTVVIPTYNEADNLPQMAAALFGLPIDSLQLLIVDDNSPDGTGAIADKLAALCLLSHTGEYTESHRGKIIKHGR